MKEGIDDITPFTGIIQLAVHPITDNGGIRLRERKDEKLFSHGTGFRQAFKMIVINPLDERAAVPHDEIIGKTVIEEKKQVRTDSRILIFCTDFISPDKIIWRKIIKIVTDCLTLLHSATLFAIV